MYVNNKALALFFFILPLSVGLFSLLGGISFGPQPVVAYVSAPSNQAKSLAKELVAKKVFKILLFFPYLYFFFFSLFV